MKTVVGLIKGDDRFANVTQALENAGDALKQKVRGKVVIKVNTVMDDEPLANTHPEALRAVLQFLQPLNVDRVIVGEASSEGLDLFRRCGYLDVMARYGAEPLDFNTTGLDDLTLLSIDETPLPARITRIHRDFDCLISLSVPKSHSDAVVTLSGKNMMGFLEGGKQWKIHGVEKFSEHLPAMAKVIHRNLRTLLAHVRPDVAVLDGFHSFEDGPVPQCGRGTLVHPKLAVAGADFVAVDTVAALALGFDPSDVGYLVYAAENGYGAMDLAQIEVVGTPIAAARFPLKPAPTFPIIMGWKQAA